MRLRKGLVVVGVAALALSACSSGGGTSSDATTTTAPPSAGLTVATDAIAATATNFLVGGFRLAHPGVVVKVVPQDYRTLSKTVADRTADLAVMPTAAMKPVQGSLKAQPFGNSQAVIVVATANPKNVTSVKAFAAGSGLRTRVCTASFALGNLGAIVLARDDVNVRPSTVGSGCEAAAGAQVAAGSLDALLVFRTGFKVPAGTKLVPIPAAQNLVIDVSFTVMGTSAPAQQLGAFMTSPTAQKILTGFGYLP